MTNESCAGIRQGGTRRTWRTAACCLAAGALALAHGACARGDRPSPSGPIEILTAGVLANPLRTAADSFATARGVMPARLEAAGSLEAVRGVTELHRTPDVLGVADAGLIQRLMVPTYATWHVAVAGDRMVLAYTPRSRGADRIDEGSWPEVITGDGVVAGRSDPDRDPAGYRALLVMKLAERHLRRPGLAARLLEHAPERLVRPRSAELVALLQAGEVDYAWLYESMASTAGLSFVRLPDSVDLGNPALASTYAAESVTVAGAARGDTLVMVGYPIVLALTIPTGAPHAADAVDFLVWLLGDEGRVVLEGAGLQLLERPEVVGSDVPPAIAQAAGAGP